MQAVESFLNGWPRWQRRLVRMVPRGQTLNRALGFPAHARLLIINADDAGLCSSHNEAVAAALDAGGVTSCTVMTTTPGFDSFAEMAQGRSDWSVGVHLVLTSEWPRLRWGPLLSESVSSLMGPDGYFYPTLFESLRYSKREHVRAEWQAQIEKALSAGIDVDHIDCHMGPYHFRPDLFRLARDLARGYGIAMRVVAPWRTQRVRRRGVPCGDRALTIPHRQFGKRVWHTKEDRRAQLLEHFSQLEPGVSIWWTHLSIDDDEWRSIRPPDEDLDQEDYPGEHRDQYEERIVDYEVLSDPSFVDDLRGLGVTPIGYGPLRALA